MLTKKNRYIYSDRIMVESRKEDTGKKETACKESLARAQDESTKISETITNAKSKVRHFDNCSLVDGLL